MVHRWQTQLWLIMVLVGGLVTAEPGWGQPVPDDTLGAENSRVRRTTVRGREADLIEGGATRGSNLFHSFREFDVREGDAAYFANPATIENIFSRVTGNNPSNILGRLGVNGTANLFLMNPNGILFGPNASLDVGGSFVGTTANAIGFGEAGFFSATNPEVPSQLLTVNPSAFFFNQVNPGRITNNSVAFAGIDSTGSGVFGLRVPDGETFLLLGGEVLFNTSFASTSGGRVEIAGIADVGVVGLNNDGSLDIPATLAKADVSLANSAIDVASSVGGTIVIHARNLNLTEGSNLRTGILPGLESDGTRVGSITLNATDVILIAGRSVVINAVFPFATGNSGDIQITTGSLIISDTAGLQAATAGQGNAGGVIIVARDRIALERRAAIQGNIETGGVGQAGGIHITTNLLSLDSNSQIVGSTGGEGNAGDITIEASGGISMNGGNTSITSRVRPGAVGQGGDVRITANSVALGNGAQLITATEGRGDAGDVHLDVQGLTSIDGTSEDGALASSISSAVQLTGIGQGGSIHIATDSLVISNGALLNASTFGQGDAGNIVVNADDTVSLDGSGITRQGTVSSLIVSSVQPTGSGQGGRIQITTGLLSLSNGSQLITATQGQGNAGDISIQARERTTFRGTRIDGPFSSTALSTVEVGGSGTGGDIEITTPILDVLEGAQLVASTRGKGDAGDVRINARDTVSFNEGDAFSTVEAGGNGQGGNIEISAGSLDVQNGAQLAASTRGQGNAGNVIIDVQDTASFIGTSTDGQRASGALSSVQAGAKGQGGNINITAGSLAVQDRAVLTASTAGEGDAGNIQIQARSLSINDGAQISAAVFREVVDSQGNLFPGGRGNAGNIRLDISDSITLAGTDESGGFSSGVLALSERGALGNAGAITIQTGELRITDGAIVTASTFNPGRSGNITIRAENLELLNGGQIVTNTRNQSDAGRIRLDVADNITISGVDPDWQERRNRARAFSEAPAGRSLRVNDIIVNQGRQSGIFANTEAAATGNGGSIRLSTTNLDLSDRARISAQSQGTGAAGGVTIRAREDVTLNNRARISTQSQGENAPAGDIQIEAGNTFTAIDSDVTTSAANASGGDIRLTTGDVRLFGDSDIRTNSARDGGNISVNADTVVALDDSDIFASAAQGRGGDITLNTPAFFGDNYQPEESGTAEVSELDNNNRVDLNATGTVSSGTISTPDTSFIQNSLSDLTENVVNTDSLIANSCIARNETGGTFLITGTGGLPSRPGSASLSTYPTGAVRTEAGEAESSSWQPGDAIVEPQGVYRLPDGRLVLSRECD